MTSLYKKYLIVMTIFGLLILGGVYYMLHLRDDFFEALIAEEFSAPCPPPLAKDPTYEVNPLCVEVANGAGPEVVYLQLVAGNRLNLLDANDQTPLMCSALKGKADPETVKALLAAGAVWDITNKNGETVLDLLAKKDSVNAQLLRKIILTEKLISLCEDGSVEAVGETIAQGVNLNLANFFQTPLMAAATDSELGVAKAKLLLAAGADVNGHNGDGMSPLQVAATRDDVGMVEFLLKEGAEVNAVDRFGRTALWEAFHHGKGKCSEYVKDEYKEKECPNLISQDKVVALLKKAGGVSQPTSEALKAF